MENKKLPSDSSWDDESRQAVRQLRERWAELAFDMGRATGYDLAHVPQEVAVRVAYESGLIPDYKMRGFVLTAVEIAASAATWPVMKTYLARGEIAPQSLIVEIARATSLSAIKRLREKGEDIGVATEALAAIGR